MYGKRALIAVGGAEIGFFDWLYRLQARMLDPEAQHLHQQRLAGLYPPTTSKKPLARQSETLRPSMWRRDGGDAFRSGAIVDVEFCRAAGQSRVALKVELAGGIVAAMAGDAAVVENRLDVGGVLIARSSRGLRIGAWNTAGKMKDHPR